MFSKVRSVNKGLKVKLYPLGDMKQKIHQNIGNARFVWNKMLEQYNTSIHNGENLACNYTTFNTMLTQLKKENDFLYNSESSSLQQVYRDLISAFNNFFDERANYPRFKSKKNPKRGFRIQNNNNIKINKNTIKLPVLGEIHYRTSPLYKKQLQESKINNVTVKMENGQYYAVFNIETEIEEFEKEFESIGIDLGVRTLATLSNELKIANLDVTREDKMIKKYYKKISRQKYKSNRYNKTLKTLGKWIQRKKNRLNDAYHKLSNYLVKNYDLICMETR